MWRLGSRRTSPASSLSPGTVATESSTLRVGLRPRVGLAGPNRVTSSALGPVSGASHNGYGVTDRYERPTAIVSGIAAPVLAQYPDLDAANVVNRLIRPPRTLARYGRDDRYGFGAVDPVAALTGLGAVGAAASADRRAVRSRAGWRRPEKSDDSVRARGVDRRGDQQDRCGDSGRALLLCRGRDGMVLLVLVRSGVAPEVRPAPPSQSPTIGSSRGPGHSPAGPPCRRLRAYLRRIWAAARAGRCGKPPLPGYPPRASTRSGRSPFIRADQGMPAAPGRAPPHPARPPAAPATGRGAPVGQGQRDN